MNKSGIAAIWCRVSTNDQRELSLDAQEKAVRQALAQAGFETPSTYLLKVDWTSLDLMACPQFQLLQKWIISGEVAALGVLDRDRLQAQGLQRLVFLAECREQGVQVITVQGVPMLDGAEGQLVEMALALGKERSVLRAQEGARDGLRTRATKKGLPPNYHSPYGMRWEHDRLVPNDDYAVACEIWQMGLEGKTLWSIAKSLTQRGLPTPKGRRVWSSTTIGGILSNRAYAGVVEALKTQAVAPKKRQAGTYGNSSTRVETQRGPGASGGPRYPACRIGRGIRVGAGETPLQPEIRRQEHPAARLPAQRPDLVCPLRPGIYRCDPKRPVLLLLPGSRQTALGR